jgi:hypothetical protein
LTELLDAPVTSPPEPIEAARGGTDHAPTELVGGAFFADLVRAHFAWERALDEGADPGRLASLAGEYDRTLKQFQ